MDLLARVAGDAGAKIYERTAAIQAAARAGEPGRALVERYVGSPNVNLIEAALGALVWTDRPEESLPLLLSYVDTDRARMATYAAARAAAFVAPSRLRDLFTPIALGSGRITSRKEALRLLARFSAPAFGETLLQCGERQTNTVTSERRLSRPPATTGRPDLMGDPRRSGGRRPLRRARAGARQPLRRDRA